MSLTKIELVEAKVRGIMRLIQSGGIMRLIQSGQLDDDEGCAIASSVITEVLLEVYEAGEMNQR